MAEVGYQDTPNFMRKFKNREGITPGQYRQYWR
ncbi:AraC family transcriptional regulator [Paenibacillus sp. PDC88]